MKGRRFETWKKSATTELIGAWSQWLFIRPIVCRDDDHLLIIADDCFILKILMAISLKETIGYIG